MPVTCQDTSTPGSLVLMANLLPLTFFEIWGGGEGADHRQLVARIAVQSLEVVGELPS